MYYNDAELANIVTIIKMLHHRLLYAVKITGKNDLKISE